MLAALHAPVGMVGGMPAMSQRHIRRYSRVSTEFSLARFVLMVCQPSCWFDFVAILVACRKSVHIRHIPTQASPCVSGLSDTKNSFFLHVRHSIVRPLGCELASLIELWSDFSCMGQQELSPHRVIVSLSNPDKTGKHLPNDLQSSSPANRAFSRNSIGW